MPAASCASCRVAGTLAGRAAPQVRLPLSSLPCTYKYGIRRADGSLALEAGENRMVALPVSRAGLG